MKMNEDRGWLLTKANEEDNCIISVGGLACRVVAEANASEEEISEATRRVAFARFVELSRRKLRMTVDGEHLYAEIKGGKIQLKDRTYDSLAHARDSVRRERNKVAVWEYFDEGVKAWRVLNRD